MTETPNEPMTTPYGKIYPPKHWALMVLAMFGMFIGGAAMGYLLSLLFGASSEAGEVVCIAPFVLIFCLGYALWLAWLRVLIAGGLAIAITRFLQHVLSREMSKELSEVLTTEDELAKLAVWAQKGSSSFAWVSVPIALVAGLLVIFVPADLAVVPRVVLLSSSCLAYGFALKRLGRRGYLPFDEMT